MQARIIINHHVTKTCRKRDLSQGSPQYSILGHPHPRATRNFDHRTSGPVDLPARGLHSRTFADITAERLKLALTFTSRKIQ